MLSIRNIIAAAIISLACAASAFAGPYSNLIVFGDSLSDVGNLKQSTVLFPVSAYYQGRFSNGPVYSELLAAELGLGTLTHSGANGTNYAVGGAQAIGGGIKSVNLQVDEFLTSESVDSGALYILFAGANDLLEGQTNVSVPVNSLLANAAELIAEGARNVLVANLPLLGLTPRFNGNSQEAAAMTQLTQQFNTALSVGLDLLELNEPNANFFRLDVAGLISNVVADPSAFGLANVTDPAAPGLGPLSPFFYSANNIVDEPDTYLFWDDLHPTRVAHAMLAQYALDVVTYSADFNFDGRVDALDLSEWEAAYSLTDAADADGDGDSDGDDFLTWQRQYTGSVPTQLTAVPEPSAIALSMLSLLWGHIASRPARSPVR